MASSCFELIIGKSHPRHLQIHHLAINPRGQSRDRMVCESKSSAGGGGWGGGIVQCNRELSKGVLSKCDEYFFLQFRGNFLHTGISQQGCQMFSLSKHTKLGKIYQMTTNYIFLMNINYLYQTVIKNINIFHSKALQNLPKLRFLAWK
jgi:hypothetical protein